MSQQHKGAARDATRVSSLTTEYAGDTRYRILALDGGGAKGFYTLGVLKEIEAMLGCPLYKRFDLVFGTSTGAIIARCIAPAQGFEACCGREPELQRPKPL